MLPLMLDVETLPIALMGRGEAYDKRLTLLTDAGAGCLDLYPLPPEGGDDASLLTRLSAGAYRLVYIAGLSEPEAHPYHTAAKANGAWVNVEDVKPLCDFHVPSLMRRGPVMITVSTDGQAAGLSKAITQHLGQTVFPEPWAQHFTDLVALRARMKAEGASFAEVAKALRDGFAGGVGSGG
ncbi:MAG: bifunctional precorrin-2 dehydrogenase/sirohydrochlorin ferrochelatase [Alphaproteobacteria bacterium]